MLVGRLECSRQRLSCVDSASQGPFTSGIWVCLVFRIFVPLLIDQCGRDYHWFLESRDGLAQRASSVSSPSPARPPVESTKSVPVPRQCCSFCMGLELAPRLVSVLCRTVFIRPELMVCIKAGVALVLPLLTLSPVGLLGSHGVCWAIRRTLGLKTGSSGA